MVDKYGPLYRTKAGVLYCGSSEKILTSKWLKPLNGKVNLIFTSPPFPLKKKKAYGNLNGQEYIDWLASFSELFNNLLAPDGSLVVDIGNSWESGLPTMSTESIEALLELKKQGNYYLCQEFIWHNPSKLPSPVQWVNIERIRVKDSFTRLWWLSKTPKPKAYNREVLQEYSPSMKSLIKKKKYNSGKRPSGHYIGEKSFLKDNGGAIPPNVLLFDENHDSPLSPILTIANTKSSDPYLKYCKENNLKNHPARMPPELAHFFIKFLTEPNDIVLDPFAGSNITGYVAESLGRKWRSIEKDEEYALASKSRFTNAWTVGK